MELSLYPKLIQIHALHRENMQTPHRKDSCPSQVETDLKTKLTIQPQRTTPDKEQRKHHAQAIKELTRDRLW